MPKDAFGNELMKPQVVPVGATHQTPAVRNHISNVLRTQNPTMHSGARPKRHRKSKLTVSPTGKGVKRRRKKAGHKSVGGGLVKLAKGSAAAIAWGKKMHAARKRKAKAA